MYKSIKNIVYLGPEGTYTEIAANKIATIMGFQNSKFIWKSSIIKIIHYLNNNNDSVGIVPIENSVEGIVRETLDNLVKSSPELKITGEIIIPISHCLLSKSKDISKIDKIISKDQALAQCQNFIAENFDNNIELIAATSTTEAVRQLADLPENHAAIGSIEASKIYNIGILAEQINDLKENKTRFVCLGFDMPDQTGNDKTSIAFSTQNKPGVLTDILAMFKENNLNLCYIESRPSKRVFGDYTFFIDCLGHIKDEQVQKTLDGIKPLINFYRFLGSYPRYK